MIELWQLSDVQVATLLSIRDSERRSLHKSIIRIRTLNKLLREKLVKRQPYNQTYIVLTARGKDIIRRIT